MAIELEILPLILGCAALFFAVYYLFYRRYIYSVLDPLFLYVFTLSFASVLVVLTLTDKIPYLIHFFVCHFFFFLGFRVIQERISTPANRVVSEPEFAFHDEYSLKVLLCILFLLYVMANVLLFYTTGFALLDDNPTSAKVENFAKGFGIILKINWGIGTFLSTGLIYWIMSHKSPSAITMLAVVLVLTALDGSKSALLRFLIIFGLLAAHRMFRNNEQILKSFYRLAPVGVVGLLGVMFVVLTKENEGSEQAVFAFVKRLLYGADSVLFFYLPENESLLSSYHFWQFPAHLFNQVLGFLRLTTVQEALGNIMVSNTLPGSYTGVIVGPNTPYYIEGQVYFGYIGAFLYSFVVGGVYGAIRNYFFNGQFQTAFWFVLVTCITQQAMALSGEVTLFITQVFDTCFFVIPIYVFVSMSLSGKILIRIPAFLR